MQGVLFSLSVLVVGYVKRFVFSTWIKVFIFLEFVLLFIPFILTENMKIISLFILNGHLLFGLLALMLIYRPKISLRVLTEKYIQKKLKNHPAISEMVIGEIQAILPIVVLVVFAGLVWGVYYVLQWVIKS